MITLAMSGAADSDAGVASGLVNTTQQVGAALGVAVLSTLAAAQTGHLLAAGRPAAEALTGGYHVAFGTGAVLAAAALVLAAAVLRPAGNRRPARPRARPRPARGGSVIRSVTPGDRSGPLVPNGPGVPGPRAMARHPARTIRRALLSEL